HYSSPTRRSSDLTPGMAASSAHVRRATSGARERSGASTASTSCPAAESAPLTWLPMNPAAPVTTTRTRAPYTPRHELDRSRHHGLTPTSLPYVGHRRPREYGS